LYFPRSKTKENLNPMVNYKISEPNFGLIKHILLQNFKICTYIKRDIEECLYKSFSIIQINFNGVLKIRKMD